MAISKNAKTPCNVISHAFLPPSLGLTTMPALAGVPPGRLLHLVKPYMV